MPATACATSSVPATVPPGESISSTTARTPGSAATAASDCTIACIVVPRGELAPFTRLAYRENTPSIGTTAIPLVM